MGCFSGFRTIDILLVQDGWQKEILLNLDARYFQSANTSNDLSHTYS